jgi:hypothetical protein
MLSRGGFFYLNGEEIRAKRGERGWMQRLADDRRLRPPVGEAAERLYGWYRAGWIEVGEEA